MTQLELAKEYVKCAMNFEYFSQTYLTTEDKTIQEYVPFKLMPHQIGVYQAYEEYNNVITNKYRQSGITSVTLAYIVWKMVFSPGTKVVLMANKLKLAKNQLLRTAANMIKKLPEFLIIKPTDSDSMEYKVYDNGSEMMALAASSDGCRGFSPHIVVLDEAAYLDELEAAYTSIKGSLGVSGKMFMISTPNGQNLFYNIYKDSRNVSGKNNFYANDLKWFRDIRLNKNLRFVLDKQVLTIVDIDVYDYKIQDDLISKGYKVECDWYLEQIQGYNFDWKKINSELLGLFIGSGANVIPDEYVNYQKEHNVKLPIAEEGLNKDVWIWKHAEPNKSYLLVSDVSSGYADDYSTIIIFDFETKEQVLEFHGKIPPDELGEKCYKYGARYNNAKVVVDVTGGYGIATILTLKNLGYKNFYYSKCQNLNVKEQLASLAKYDGDVPGFTIGTNRNSIIEELQKQMAYAFVSGGLGVIIRSNRLINEFGTFVYFGNKPNHIRSAFDDLLITCAIGYYILKDDTNLNLSVEQLKQMSASWVVVDYNNKINYTIVVEEELDTEIDKEKIDQLKKNQLIANNAFFYM